MVELQNFSHIHLNDSLSLIIGECNVGKTTLLNLIYESVNGKDRIIPNLFDTNGNKHYFNQPDINNLNIGKKNAELNNVNIDFTQGFIGKKHINVMNFMKEKNIEVVDILHSDIQGYEFEMLTDIEPLLKDKKIKYLFISTHSNEIHYKCIDLLKHNNYYIIASADFDTETFCYDGIIVASYIDIGTYNLGCRKHTKLVNNCIM
jgi:hypothetical protein